MKVILMAFAAAASSAAPPLLGADTPASPAEAEKIKAVSYIRPSLFANRRDGAITRMAPRTELSLHFRWSAPVLRPQGDNVDCSPRVNNRGAGLGS